MAKSTVAVKFTGETAGLKRALGDIDGKMRGFGSKIGKIGKTAGLAFAGIAGGAVVLGKGFVDAAVESEKVGKQTGAVIESMGLSAKVSADQIAALSDSLAKKSGVDDEVIQSGQNVLLTFANVADSAGDAGGIFEKTTGLALDMSVALGTDMTSSSMQLGKALNDPVKGLTKLQRSGVSFTDQQKEQVKAMVEAGDVAGAQALMLEELEKQFGGSAEAQATAGDKLKVVVGNLQEEMGKKLLPVVEKVAGWLGDNLPGAMDKVGKVIGPVAKQIGMFFNTLSSGFTEDEGTPIERFALKVREWVPKIVEGIRQIVTFIQENWPKIQDVITQAMTVIGDVIAGVISVVTTLWNNFGNNILTFMQAVWPQIQQVIGGAMAIIQGIIKTVTALIKGDWSGVWEGIKQIVSGAWEAIKGIVGAAIDALKFIIGVGLEIVGSVFKSAWSGITDWFGDLPGKLSDIAGRAWNGLKSGLAAVIDWIIGQIDRALGPIDEILGKLGSLHIGGGTSKNWGGGGSWGNGHAGGGLMRRGEIATVGERGRELFQASTAGRIIPNHRLATGGGSGVTVIVQMSGIVTTSTRQFEDLVVQAVNRATRKGKG